MLRFEAADVKAAAARIPSYLNPTDVLDNLPSFLLKICLHRNASACVYVRKYFSPNNITIPGKFNFLNSIYILIF